MFLAIISIVSVSKYFYKAPLTQHNYETAYLSDRYIAETVAFKVSEYLPKTAKYTEWKDAVLSDYDKPAFSSAKNSYTTIKNDGFVKTIKMTADSTVRPNIHTFPYWRIMVNNHEILATSFDSFGRPIISAKNNDVITAEYHQSPVERIGNGLTVLSLCILTAVVLYKPLWKKKSSLST